MTDLQILRNQQKRKIRWLFISKKTHQKEIDKFLLHLDRKEKPFGRKIVRVESCI